MPNKSSDKVIKGRNLKVFLALSDYAHATTDKLPPNFSRKDFQEDDFSWNGLTVSFNVKKPDLQRICGAKSSQKALEYRREISDQLSQYLPIVLGSLFVDRRSKKELNAGVWKFDITFWELTRERSIERFNEEWEKKRSSGAFEVDLKKGRSTSTTELTTKKDRAIEWHKICHDLLAEHKRQLSSNPLDVKQKNFSVYVPLGLVERKEKQRPQIDRSLDPSADHGSELYQEVKTTPIEHDDFLQAVGDRKPGEHIVILGEPGAGKTTLLTRVWESLLAAHPESPSIVIWISLTTLKDLDLEGYLRDVWLKQIFKSTEIDIYWQSFQTLLDEQRVWLLFDGADEMGGDGLSKIQTILQPMWVKSKIRAVVTCRLNL
jgi:NACHT domain